MLFEPFVRAPRTFPTRQELLQLCDAYTPGARIPVTWFTSPALAATLRAEDRISVEEFELFQDATRKSEVDPEPERAPSVADAIRVLAPTLRYETRSSQTGSAGIVWKLPGHTDFFVGGVANGRLGDLEDGEIHVTFPTGQEVTFTGPDAWKIAEAGQLVDGITMSTDDVFILSGGGPGEDTTLLATICDELVLVTIVRPRGDVGKFVASIKRLADAPPAGSSGRSSFLPTARSVAAAPRVVWGEAATREAAYWQARNKLEARPEPYRWMPSTSVAPAEQQVLTGREQRILELMLKGRLQNEIARTLQCDCDAVQRDVEAILQKQAFSSREQGTPQKQSPANLELQYTPDLDSGALAALTRREREIARLIAGGLSNREVAKRLVISQRTVDSHVEHIYGKLGISSRVVLSTLVIASPPPSAPGADD